MSDHATRTLTISEAVRALMNDGCPARFAEMLAGMMEICGDDYEPRRGEPFVVVDYPRSENDDCVKENGQ